MKIDIFKRFRAVDDDENRTREMVEALNEAVTEPATIEPIDFVANAKVTFEATINRVSEEIKYREEEMSRLRAELDGLYCVKQAYQVGICKLNGNEVKWEDIQP